MNHSMQKRVALTSSCHDCDALPKVENAGEVINGDPRYQVMHNGLKVILGGYHGDWMERIISNLSGHHEPQEEKAFYEVLKFVPSGGTMIELGSYWAYYSMWFQHCIENASNYMVEPNKEKIVVGKENFLLNNMQGRFINASVGSSSIKDASFIDWDATITQVEQVAIDALLEGQGIDYVDILHADIQGAEVDMLSGAEQSLRKKKIRFLFISTHGYCHKKCLRLLAQFGYQVICEHSIEQSCSGDGLIVAKSPNVDGPEYVGITRYKAPFTRWMFVQVKGFIHSLREKLL